MNVTFEISRLQKLNLRRFQALCSRVVMEYVMKGCSCAKTTENRSVN